ncbi:hypothetical protein ACIQZB_25205 [Streptomyces sp. NPDC097727]|uniref:hypothetical protein n=1 Tax=Streptomyces sp. NPDC097727 TaxID=3366092 RepID=UPI00382C8ECA
MVHLGRLGPIYNDDLPVAALHLGAAIDTGKPGLLMGDDAATLLTVDDLASRMGAHVARSEVRGSIHGLPAAGAALVAEHEDLPLLRVVAGQPRKPGEPWILAGSLESANVPSAGIPTHAQEQLTAQQLGALMYMRPQKADFAEPDPEEFGRFEGVDGSDHARRLSAAVEAIGLVDHRGCGACPAGRLCTRGSEETAPG